jgi:hypothetical protein
VGKRTSHRLGKLSEEQRTQVNEQLSSYYNNAAVGMNKDSYFEMCEALGSEPIDSEIPVEYDDFPVEVQESIRIYNNLQDNWDYMGGNYIGKNLNGFKDILSIFEVDPQDYRAVYELIMRIDQIRAKSIQDSKPKT